MPTLVTALAGIVGSAVMLLVLEPTVGAVAAVVLLVAVLASRPYLARSEFLAACLHAGQEREAASIDTARPLRIARHFRITGGRRVALSDLEAKAYVGVGVVTAGLFALAFVHLAGESGTTAGHLYTVTSYLWTFAFGLDDLPQHLAQLGRLRELGTRIRPGLDADDDADED